nr:MAG TPA: hypothetical protein [Caudoviricetes sp.]
MKEHIFKYKFGGKEWAASVLYGVSFFKRFFKR